MTAVDEAGTALSVRNTSQVINDTVKQFRAQVPECIASGLVDMSTGMLLAVDTLDDHPGEVLDLIAAATFDLFQGRNVTMIEEIFKARYGVLDDRHYFQEFLAQSDSYVHVFLRSTNQDIVGVVVARKTANTGMILTQARLVMKQLDAGLS